MKISQSLQRAVWPHQGPEVVGHFLSVLQDSPEEEVPQWMLTVLLQVDEIFLVVEEPTLAYPLLVVLQTKPKD